MQQITSAVKEVAVAANHQAEVLTEASPAVEELTKLAHTIVSMAKDLSRDTYEPGNKNKSTFINYSRYLFHVLI